MEQFDCYIRNGAIECVVSARVSDTRADATRICKHCIGKGLNS